MPTDEATAAGHQDLHVSPITTWSNAAMTLNVYAHLWPDDEDRSRQAIDVALGDSRPDVPKVRPKRGSRGRLPRSEG